MGHDDELWQAYTKSGEPVTQPLTKAKAGTGILHGASHVWIWRRGSHGLEMLLQRRAPDKLTWPNHLDISAAGHIDFGESPLGALLREAQEEIGLKLDTASVELLFVHRAYLQAGAGIIENEFQWVYGYESTEEMQLTFADGEVVTAEWLPFKEFRELVRGASSQYQIVQHGDVYFMNLMAGISRMSGI